VSVPVEYLCSFLVIIERMFFRIEISSLHSLSCLGVLTHASQLCIPDSSAAYSLSTNGSTVRTLLSSSRTAIPSGQHKHCVSCQQ